MTTLSRASARLTARVLVAGLLIAVLASCRPMSESETNLFVATNKLREQNGLPAYAQQEGLVDQARDWAKTLAARSTLDHSDPYAWAVAWTAVAENVAYGSSAEKVFADLASSDSHRANMLSTKYTHMAVGTARGKDGNVYAVQLFWRG